MSSARLINCDNSLLIGEDVNKIITVYYEPPLLDKITKKSMRYNSDNNPSPLGDGPVLTQTQCAILENQGTWKCGESPPNIEMPIIQEESKKNNSSNPRKEVFSVSLNVGPSNFGSLTVKINNEELKTKNNLNDTSDKIWGAVWTDPGPSMTKLINNECDGPVDSDGNCIEFIGNTENVQYNEFTDSYTNPLTSNELNWIDLEKMEPEMPDNPPVNFKETRLVADPDNVEKNVFSWVEAGEYDNSNGSIFSETLAMINSGLVWDQRSSSVDINRNVICDRSDLCKKEEGGESYIEGMSYVEGMGCVKEIEEEGDPPPVDPPPVEFQIDLNPCLNTLDFSDLNTTLKNGNVKTFVIFLIHGKTLEEAQNGFDYGCQTTIHIIVKSDRCLKGWTGLPDPTTTVKNLIERGISINRTEPLELMEGCSVLGCLDPITGKYQTKTTRPDFQNNPREYCEWISMSAAQPANLGDVDDINSNIDAIKSGLEENKGRKSIDSNSLKTNWNINTKMFRTTFSDSDPCIPTGEEEPNSDCFNDLNSERVRGYSIISKIKDAENKSPNGIDGPLGDLYGRKWLEITDNNCVYDSYTDDCVERRCGVGNQGENCTVPCCKGACVYPERGGIANTASTNAENGWPLIQTSIQRDDYMPIPYEVGVDQSSWCKNEIGCEFYLGREDGNLDSDNYDTILVYNSGNGGSLEDGSSICTQCAGPPNWLEFDNRSSSTPGLNGLGDGSSGSDSSSSSGPIGSSGAIPSDINFAPGADYTGPQCNMRCCGSVCDPLGGNAQDQCATQPIDASLTRNYCQYFEEWNKCLEICQGSTSEECTSNRGCKWGVDPGNGTGSENLTACLPNLCQCENGLASVGRNCALHDSPGCVKDMCDFGYYTEEVPMETSECSKLELELDGDEDGGECVDYEYFICKETWWHKFGMMYLESMDIEEIAVRFFGNDEGGPVRSIVFLCIISSSLIALSGFLQILSGLSNPSGLMKSSFGIIISFILSIIIYFVPVLFYTLIYCGWFAFGCDGNIPYGNAWTLLYKILAPFLLIFILIIVFKSFISITLS